MLPRTLPSARWTLAAMLAAALGAASAPGQGGDNEVPPPLDEARRLESHLTGLYKLVRPSIVGLRITPTDEGHIQGSGVFVTADGFILTAAHCISKPGAVVEAVMHDGRVVRARNLGRYTTADAGLMKTLDEGPYPFSPMGSSKALVPGSLVVALGHPAGVASPPLRLGRLLATEKEPLFLKSTCIVEPGDSGGPLLDIEGRVVGINSHISAPMDENYHAAIEPFIEHWDRLRGGETFGQEMGRPLLLGLRVRFQDAHALVRRVTPDGPAARAGIRVDDRLTHVNGERLVDEAVLARTLAASSRESNLVFTVQRGGETFPVPVDLKPPDGSRNGGSR